MGWMAIHIQTNHHGLDAVETFLSGLGIDNVVIDDETEFHDFLEENRQHWDYVDEELLEKERGVSKITFYLEANEDGFSTLGMVRVALQNFKAEHTDCGPLLMTMDELEEADWAFGWQKYYKPMEIGERLVVIPAWEKDSAARNGRIPLVLDPGLAFGTGSHATTRLCLEFLDREIKGGETVVDLGCGSGILSIAALILGAKTAQAVDVDASCVEVAYANAALNGVGRERYAVLAGDVTQDGALRAMLGGENDVVVANIVADVILSLAPLVRQFLKPGGLFLCSGVIDQRAVEVADGLRRAGWAIMESRREGGWFAYACR